MTNFDYYIKSGRTEESWEEAWEDFLKFNKSVSDKEKTGRAIDRYNRWLLKEHKEPILDDAEREYLLNIIKPFRNKVLYIAKIDNMDTYFIEIGVNNTNDTYKGVDYALLPNFNRLAKMYMNMKPDYRYTLEELNL